MQGRFRFIFFSFRRRRFRQSATLVKKTESESFIHGGTNLESFETL